jgi:hypothetical protein
MSSITTGGYGLEMGWEEGGSGFAGMGFTGVKGTGGKAREIEENALCEKREW